MSNRFLLLNSSASSCTVGHKLPDMFFSWHIMCLVLCLPLWMLLILSSWALFMEQMSTTLRAQLSPSLLFIFFLENLPNYGFNSHLCFDKLKPYYPQHGSLPWVLDSYLQQPTGYFFLTAFRYFTWNKLLVELIVF